MHEIKLSYINLAPIIANNYNDRKLFVLYDENVRFIVAGIDRNFDSIIHGPVYYKSIKCTESRKNLDTVKDCYTWLLDNCCARRDVLISIGGGICMDIGNYVAATFNRGIWSINVPTTLLGMVDAAIGGKCGVNLRSVKNIIGTFHIPVDTVINVEYLNTLPSKEMFNGMFEMLKTFALFDEKSFFKAIHFFRQIWQNNIPNAVPLGLISEQNEILYDLITKAANYKKEIVKKDFYETSNRKWLNFGHTLGHVWESTRIYVDYEQCHGMMVGYGMLAILKHYAPEAVYKTFLESLIACGLKPISEPLPFIREFLVHDKKADSCGQIEIVTLVDIGHPTTKWVFIQELEDILKTFTI